MSNARPLSADERKELQERQDAILSARQYVRDLDNKHHELKDTLHTMAATISSLHKTTEETPMTDVVLHSLIAIVANLADEIHDIHKAIASLPQ